MPRGTHLSKEDRAVKGLAEFL